MTSAARPTVILVDDAAEVRLLVKAHLELSGQFVVVGEGSNGLEAIELAREFQPSLIVLDVSMPRMDGLEALPRIRAVSPQTRIVMYTGFDEEGLAARARSLGATALIEKSMSVDQLPGQLLALLGDTSPPAEAAADPVGAPADRGALPDESALAEHLERFREVFEEAAIGMATMTLTGRIVRANRALAALVGRSLDELVAMSYAELAATEDARTVTDALHRAQDGEGEVVRFEHRVIVDGVPRWVLTTAAPVKDARERPLYLFLQSQNITAQRSAEEELRRSEEQFAMLVDAVEDYAIFMLDPNGYIMSWNSGAQRIKGYAASEAIGQHFRMFYPEHVQASKHPERELELAIENGHYEEEGWRVRKDGTQFWANVLITTVRNRAGEHVGFAKVTRNIDERRRMLLDLEAANERLAQDAADQAQFLAVTAHELRTPISVLSGSASLLGEHGHDMDEADRSELFQSIESSAKRLQRLLRDLLTASRLESNSIELRAQHINVDKLIERTVRAARTASPGAEITFSCEPRLRALGEHDHVAQALDNLLANALRHGAPPIHVAAQRKSDQIEITVSDGGPGVAEDVRERLFQRFVTGASGGGTGLGLFIVRQLARAQQGDAWYLPPDGTMPSRFVLSLPAVSPAAPGSVQ